MRQAAHEWQAGILRNCLLNPSAAAAPTLLSENLPEVAAARERGILIAERIGRGALPPAGLGRLLAVPAACPKQVYWCSTAIASPA